MKLGSGLHRIGNDIVAAYLIVTPDGVTVIDAGLSGHWRDLLVELRATGRSLADIRGLILTHGDTDHIGFAERLHRETGVPIYVHSDDAERAQGRVRYRATWGRMRPAAVARFLWYTIRKGGLRTRYLTEVLPVTDGEVLDLPGAPRIIALPGHSAGSIAILSPAADALFVGDALTTRDVLTGNRGPQPAPFTDDPGQALSSLDRLDGIIATWVLPGHGPAWNGGVPQIVRRIRAAAAIR